jgi:hypothetical protein
LQQQKANNIKENHVSITLVAVASLYLFVEHLHVADHQRVVQLGLFEQFNYVAMHKWSKFSSILILSVWVSDKQKR